MGEAKRKKAAREAAVQSLSEIDIARVAAAVRKMFAAISPARGVDCCLYASYGQHLLQRLGVAAEVAIGHAAWRVGDGDGDVIVHHPGHFPSHVELSPDQLPYHAWIQVAGRVIDFSTHDLPYKVLILNAQDGRRTTVAWHPDYLVAERHEIAGSVTQVGQAQRAPIFYYERVPTLEARFHAETRVPPPEALSMLWMIYRHPDVMVFGPSNFMEHA